MEERVEAVEKQLAELTMAFERSCEEQRFISYQKVCAVEREQERMRKFDRDLAAASTETEKLWVFISLFPENARELVFEAFMVVSRIYGGSVEEAVFWGHGEHTSSWRVTIEVGRDIKLFKIDHQNLTVGDKAFPITPERCDSINELMMCFYGILN